MTSGEGERDGDWVLGDSRVLRQEPSRSLGAVPPGYMKISCQLRRQDTVYDFRSTHPNLQTNAPCATADTSTYTCTIYTEQQITAAWYKVPSLYTAVHMSVC